MIHRTASGLNRRLRKVPVWDRLYKHWMFRIERDLINGRTHEVVDHPSILHFSVNKAATQYTKRIMIQCAQENGLYPVQMSAYAFNFDFPYIFTQTAEENEPYIHVFKPKGYLYTVFGGLVEGISQIDKYLTVIMLRDPRDVLVSGYYSYTFSHMVPPDKKKAKEFLEFRKHLQTLSVDEYALENAEPLKENLQKYMNVSKQIPSVTVLKYEDMIADFPTWLEALLECSQLKISSSLKTKLIEESNQTRKRKKEDTSKHRRQVTPGDHLRKLQPETIAYLNEVFAEITAYFQYPMEADLVDQG